MYSHVLSLTFKPCTRHAVQIAIVGELLPVDEEDSLRKSMAQLAIHFLITRYAPSGNLTLLTQLIR